MTEYHAKYFAHELTKRCASDSVEKLATALVRRAGGPESPPDRSGTVRVPLAVVQGCDPRGRSRPRKDDRSRASCSPRNGRNANGGCSSSCPANLRKQWSQELADKFFLPSAILETRTFNEAIRGGNLNPFLSTDAVVICSYQFARSKEPYIRQTPGIWSSSTRRTGCGTSTSRQQDRQRDQAGRLRLIRKVLLTATPLQNSLLELYGLVSIIDEYAFGDLKSFRAQFTRLGKRRGLRRAQGTARADLQADAAPAGA